MELIAGIDIGTGSCKTVVTNSTGSVIASASGEYVQNPQATAGKAEVDPECWWQAAVSTLQAACEKAGLSLLDIVAVGCSGQMQGCTFLGLDGRPTRPSMLWFGTEPIAQSERLNREHLDAFMRNCLTPSTTSLTGSKIAWVMENEPEVWERTACFVFAPGYINYRLTGVIAADRSNLGLSGLNNLVSGDWSDELFEVTRVARSKAPSLLDCLDTVGYVSREAARETGLREGIPVIAGCGDGPAECFSVNIAGRSEIKLRLGSAAAASAVVPRCWLGDKIKKANPYVDRDHYVTGGYTKGCALSVKWLRDTFFSELPKEDASYDLMDKEAENSRNPMGDLIFHPYLNGEASRYNDPNLRAKFTGMHFSHDRSNFVRAVYEGISFSIRDLIESYPVLDGMERIVFCGGGTKSKYWMPILADILGRGGIIPCNADAAFGVALMAGQSIGLFDAGKAADRSREDGIQLEFDPVRHRSYQQRYLRYLELVSL